MYNIPLDMDKEELKRRRAALKSRYEEKMNRMEDRHERDREQWKEIDKEKDKIIDELGKKL